MLLLKCALVAFPDFLLPFNESIISLLCDSFSWITTNLVITHSDAIPLLKATCELLEVALKSSNFVFTDAFLRQVGKFCIFLFDLEEIDLIEKVVHPFAKTGHFLYTSYLRQREDHDQILQKIFLALCAKISSSSVKIGYLLMFSYLPPEYLLERKMDFLKVLERLYFFLKVSLHKYMTIIECFFSSKLCHCSLFH